MKILKADYILTCNDNFEIIKDGAICFDKNIIEVGRTKDIINKYKEVEIIEAGENSVLLPGLINTHVHLEFSANKTSLKYGDFMPWLNSVIKNRDEILHVGGIECIENELQNMLEGGITTLGEISSFGEDFEACVKTPVKVVYFNEVLGSKPDAVDVLFNDFLSRLHKSEEYRSESFIPAISVHSAYSTHPILAKHALDIARSQKYLVSTHFMETNAERQWLDSGSGEFIEFFNAFAPNAKPHSSALEYLELFEGTNALFTHCAKANTQEIKQISQMGAFITHCPVSNRLLGSGKLNIQNIDEEILTLGTDGLSSNISLSLWDEMRAALMMHHNEDLNDLSKKLLKMCTANGAKSLKLKTGILEKNKAADILVIVLPDKIQSTQELAIQLILHTKKANRIYINGEKI